MNTHPCSFGAEMLKLPFVALGVVSQILCDIEKKKKGEGNKTYPWCAPEGWPFIKPR